MNILLVQETIRILQLAISSLREARLRNQIGLLFCF